MRLSLTIGCLLSLALSAPATTNYVAVTGSDGAAGTIGAPWATIQHAADTSSPGDTVLVQPGTYDEQTLITKPGVTFRANGAGVILVGQFILSSADTFHPTRNSSGTVIDGFEMRGISANSQLGCVYFGDAVTNAWVINNTMHDTQVWSSQGAVGPVTFSSDSTGSNSCSGTVISNNVIYNTGGVAVMLKGFNGIIVGNWISNTYGCDCFNIQGANMIVRSNFCTQVGLGICNLWGASNSAFNGTYWYSPSATATNGFGTWYGPSGLTLVYSPDTYVARGWSNAAVVMNAATNHSYASASRMYNTWTMHDPVMGTAFTQGMGAVEHSDWVESLGPLVNPSSPLPGLLATNILLENNIIVNCPGGSTCMFGGNTTNYPGPCLDWTFRNNVWIWTEVTGGITDVRSKFYNNTFYQCATGGNSGVLSFTFFPTNSPDPRGWAFYSECKSNAFVGCGPGSSQGWYGAAAAGVAADWGVSDISWPHYPLDTFATNADYNYVGEVNGAAKDSDSPNYPSTSPFKFSEPHGINGGHVFVDLTNGIYAFTNAGTIYGANLHFVYTNGPPPPSGDTVTNGLVLRYTFDTITPTNVPDWTGNGHPGWNMQGTNWITPTNGVFGTQAGYWVTNGVASNGAQAYLVSTYLAVTNLNGLTNMPGFSLSVWTKTKDIPPDSAIMAIAMSGYSVPFSGNAAACSNSWDLRRVTSSEMQFIVHTLDDDHLVLDFPCDTVSCNNNGDLTQTNYHHYGVSFTNGTFTGYHDGVPFQTNTLAVPYLTVYGGPGQQWLCIGADSHNGVPTWGNTFSPNDAFYAGAMDDFRIFNRALSPSEFAAIYAGTGGGTNPPSNNPPTISVQPANTTVASGATATFSVTAAGTAPLAYQWRFTASPIAGATNASYSKSGVTTNDAGNYTVVITNLYGAITSSVATLTVTNPPPPPPLTNNVLLWIRGNVSVPGAASVGK